MTLETTKYIFLFLVGTSVLNFAIAVMVRIKTQHKEFNDLLIYWPCIILTFIAAALLSATPLQIGLAYFFQIFSSNLIVKMMCSAQGIKIRWPMYIGIQLIAMATAAYLLTTEVGFTAAIIPVSLAFSLPFIEPIWHSLIENRKASSWIEKAMGWVFLTGIVNHFNYAFFRLDPDAAFWGWSVSIAQYQCLSLFLPLLINHRREEKERMQLNQALEKLSGKNPEQNMELDALYANLEQQIAQKEELFRLLKESNTHLEEERETNEILIRTISHDLVNPLSVVGSYSEMLSTNRVPEKDLEKIWDRLKFNITSALEMMERIRSAILNRAQSNMIVVRPIDLGPCLQRLQSSFETRLNEKNITLKIVNSLEPGTQIMAEEKSLTEHVLSNLLSNAIKFSFKNDLIEINVNEDNNFVIIQIRDYGMGIKQNQFKKPIFISSEGTEGESGTGFGLMVLGYFVRKFKAEFAIFSNPQMQGTLVTLKFIKAHGEQIIVKQP
jgi:signal transduction histidine kinase